MSFTWKDALAELDRRRALARELGGERRVNRAHDQGRYTIRERIDRAASAFYEVGEFAAYEDVDATGKLRGMMPASYVCGLGEFAGRAVAVGGEDFTVRGGAPQTYLDRMKGGLGGFVEDLAHEYRIPLVLFMEGIGGDVAAQAEKGHSYLVSSLSWQRSYELLAEVPVLTMVSGAAVGGTAGRTVLSHFSVMTKDSVLFAGGPPLVKRALGVDVDKHELGGARVHTAESGCIDNLAEDEDDAIRQLQTVLGYLPQNVWEMPPRGDRSDPPDRWVDEVLDIIPENRRRPYKASKVVSAVVDRGSFFEVGARWGRAVTTGFARMDGIPVGIVASNPQHLGGALDAAAAEKQVRFVDTCSTFHLPIVYFVDVPGFMVGPNAERGNVVRWGMRAIQSIIQAEVPVVTIQVRKAYGMAVSATSSPDSLSLRLAWPTAEWGDLPVEGGVEAGFKHEIENAENPEEYRRLAEERMLALADPWKTAEAFGVENMIDPRDTREIVCAFLEASLHRVRTSLGPQRRQWSLRP
ncbi:acyl-CoA carboxylase subunit beta [Saccharopolyspora elongata]|uniref:Propionyl-CoA carboxylase n=1 Tax=Saccharopolyspora elongata TaxID=2530387 RepID=A0A4R4XSK3_9PSEU|nr:carboxyl transferase domain-containing protein [Saccharopolyspora elongata]TDD34104.1 propionyl-CoA carboxylase [Saccharopolyspora elongata]